MTVQSQRRGVKTKSTRHRRLGSDRANSTNLRIELLEDRRVLAPILVTSAADSGLGSLREAIALSNTLVGRDNISFAIGTGAQTINLLSALPNITDAVDINGTSQPGFSGQPIIELNGQAAGFVSGLTLAVGNSTVRGLAINRFGSSGIDILSNGNTIAGNYIGVDLTGTLDRGNGLYGVNITASSNQIGGLTAADRNVISANGISGVYIDAVTSTQNVVQGNYIGTNAQATAAIGNGFDGVEIFNGSSNTVGGLVAGAANIISGNLNVGVGIAGPAASNNLIQGNLIGTDASGTQPIGNEFGGVTIESPNNTVGGTMAAAANIISGNLGAGVILFGPTATGNAIQGNTIGLALGNAAPLGNALGGVNIIDASNNTIGGTAVGAGNRISANAEGGILVFSGTGNAIFANRISGNANLGIDLASVDTGGVPIPDGITPNDPNDADTGANNLQNFPLLNSVFALGTSTRFIGSLQSTPNAAFRLEFFASDAPDTSTNGEGANFLDAVIVMTGADGIAVVDVTLPVAVAKGQYITATATSTQNNTSEFSNWSRAVGPKLLVTGGGLDHVGEVAVFDETTLVELRRFQPYGAANIPIRVASADFNADGISDIVTAAGPGGGPHVRVFDGATGNLLPGVASNFFAYAPTFTGGVYVAVGDVNGDTIPDIITGADAGGGPHVQVFHGATGAVFYSFFAYDSTFTGGVRVAAGDIDGDMRSDIITAAGPGGGPHVRVFSGATGNQLASPIGSFFAFPSTFTGGVYISSGNFNGGPLDIVTGAGAGGGPHIQVFDGLTGAVVASPIGSFFAYAPEFTGGVRVATADANGDSVADIVTGAGPGGGPHVRVINGATGGEIFGMFAFDPGSTGGVFPAASSQPGITGSPLQVRAGQPSADRGDLLSAQLVSGIVDGLLARLGAGLLPDSLNIEIGNLPPGYLGSFDDGTIWLDDDAAGYGWFIDPSPLDDAEFLAISQAGAVATAANAQGRIDLLTVLAHELGHALGFDDRAEDEDPGHWMADHLAVGVRRIPARPALD